MKLIEVSSTYQILKFAYIFIHAVGWAAIPYSPLKRCDSASQKQADTAQCFGNSPYLPKLLRWFVPDPTFGLLRKLEQPVCVYVYFPESRQQSLPHPYSPLRANTFLRNSRNWMQASNPHLNKSFGMNLVRGDEARNEPIARILVSHDVHQNFGPNKESAWNHAWVSACCSVSVAGCCSELKSSRYGLRSKF